MDSFIRQSALEILFQHVRDLKEEQLTEAICLGLSDDDLQINELAWNFVKEQNLETQYKKEIFLLADKFQQTGENYYVALAKEIVKMVG